MRPQLGKLAGEFLGVRQNSGVTVNHAMILHRKFATGKPLKINGLILSHISCRLCENSDAKLANRIFAEIWPVLSDQKPVNRRNSL